MCTVTVQIHRRFSDHPLVMQIHNRSRGACMFIPGSEDWGEFDLPIV
jgi:hypothetical protein